MEYQKLNHRGTLSYIISLWNRTQRVNLKHLYQICSRVNPIYRTALIHYFHQWPSTDPEALQHCLFLLMICRCYSLWLTDHRSKSEIDQWSRLNIKLVKRKSIMSLNWTKSKSMKIYSKRKTNQLWGIKAKKLLTCRLEELYKRCRLRCLLAAQAASRLRVRNF